MEIPKKKWVILGAVLAAVLVIIIGIIISISLNSKPAEEESKEEVYYPPVAQLLAEPNSENALLMKQMINAKDAAEQKEIAKEVRRWIEKSLAQYGDKKLSAEDAKKRIQFVQNCGALDADEVLEWVRKKNDLDILLKAESLYNEALEWFNEDNYRLARESAAMISEEAAEYYELAVELIRQCDEKEAEALRLAEEAKKQEYLDALAEICNRYETMSTGTLEDCSDLLDEYQAVLAKIQDMSIGNQLMQEAQSQYPLKEWKIECKRLILENMAAGKWKDDTGFALVENHSNVPYLVVQTDTAALVYHWSSIHHMWELYQPPSLDAVYVGMDGEDMGFLYANLTANEETYYWLKLTDDGWVQQDCLEKRVETHVFLWVIKTQRMVYYQNGEVANMMQYRTLVENYVTKCENSRLPQATAQSLEETLAKY
ncbi:MAG: hypothetical protein IJ315_07005 [Firmicutes bacterium]|nr:hypothetical protein [Bacillota bacterium]